MSELRNRGATLSANTMENEKTKSVVRELGSGMAAKSLIDASPQQHGVVLKLHLPFVYNLIPSFLLSIIYSIGCLSFLLPSWKQRYLISCGSYLYKFKDQQSKSPKGCPFDLATMSVDLIPKENSPHVGALPPGFDAIICVSTLRRKQYYAVRDREEAMLWVRSLTEAKQAVITRNLGHDKQMPYPQSWKHFDSLAAGLVKSKERIKERMETQNMREMEMTNFMDGGPLPRGYHG
ncbi:unnamed protein product [Cylindrotheca closterium]|uniref:PH domain-containing protein n=1 Tax=Cylindrotheca closterium TaxID=2856 RepID=A0AAD2CCY0_9STRA|nr:unnamed protein product [Cylindrotheca closterium]